MTPEIAERAAALARGAKTERDRVAALYEEVARLRYVAVPLGVNSHRPHAAANVFRNRYGDCKDKANLLNTMLRSIGIEAHLVLVPRFTQAHDEVPGLAFNHAISRIRLGDEVIWADTTDEVSRFGVLPPGDHGRKVLVIDGSAALVTLPAPRPADHRLALRARLRPEPGAPGAFRASIQTETSGYPDYELRVAARAAAAPGPAAPVLLHALRPAAGQLALARQVYTPVDALSEAFAWSGEGTIHGLVASIPGSDRVTLRAPLFLPREWDQALHARRSPLLLNQGYPLTLRQEVDLELPAGATDVSLPPPHRSDAAPLRFDLGWSRTGTTLRAALDLGLAGGELTLDETLAFQARLRELLTALAAGPSYREPSP